MNLNWNTKRRWMHLICVASLALVAGCASTGAPLRHTLRYCNVGQVDVVSPKITYGKVIWPMTRQAGARGGVDPHCRSGVSINDHMPVPETMLVEWQLGDGRSFAVTVPVRAKLKWGYAPNTIEVQFKDETVEVLEHVKPTEATRIYHPIYP